MDLDVSDIRRGEARSVAGVLAAALQDDPGWSAVVPSAAARRRVLQSVLRAAVADAARSGRVLVARPRPGGGGCGGTQGGTQEVTDRRFGGRTGDDTGDDTGDGTGDGTGVLGAAVWLPPGAYPMTAGRKTWAALRLLPAGVRDPGGLRAAAAFGSAVDAAFPAPAEGPVAYLQVLGVRPSAARRGVGRALLAPLLAHPCAVYLETSAPGNVAYYERAGFAVLPGSPAPIGGRGPVMWRMARPSPSEPPASPTTRR
ncbi:GNAT family N-acetyltransferase [Motilibacter sp. E257]|uniref:GNAT family N-acetyltransferase n=1 Tax=Motilibacter deserti TaxID=2714956 RepID=A0ABX0GRC2_9ACTN|nr:GNAT family N-acetyltransferase [Motilibacter deserti]